MNVLDTYGFHEQDVQKVQFSCTEAVTAVRIALEDLGMNEEAENIYDLEQNFEDKVQERFLNVAERYMKVHDTSAVPLDEIGDCLLASMLYETAYTLNGIEAFQELDMAKYGASDLTLNGEYALDELIRRGDFAQEINNPELASIDDYADIKETMSSRLVFSLAESLHDLAGFDKDGYGCGEALSDYEKAVGEALGEGTLSFQQAFEALQDYKTYCREDKLNEVSEIVDERFQELWQEDKKVLDME